MVESCAAAIGERGRGGDGGRDESASEMAQLGVGDGRGASEDSKRPPAEGKMPLSVGGSWQFKGGASGSFVAESVSASCAPVVVSKYVTVRASGIPI